MTDNEGVEPSSIGAFSHFVRTLVEDTFSTSWALIKITVPVIILTKLLEELGLIGLLSEKLEPFMGIMGLPGELGLVWATAMFTTLYGAMAVFATLAPGLDLSVAQVTVICSLMLIVHSLPLELTITKKAGAPFLPIAALRIGGGLIYGTILHFACLWGKVLQEPAIIIFHAKLEESGIIHWAISQGKNLLLIILVIFCILIIMRILRIIRLLQLLEWILEPVLPLFGMSKRAAPVTVVGMVMGISYGGALIIREANSGKMEKEEVFFSLALMALSHSLVEDTLLMMALGASLWGILAGRVLFSLLVIYVLSHLIQQRAKRHGPRDSQ